MVCEFFIDVFEEMFEKFRVVIKERCEEEEQQQCELVECQEKISIWLELMKVDGINLEELLGNSFVVVLCVGKKCQLCLVKYKFIDVNGEIKIWIGQGCILKLIVQVLVEGKFFDDFLI